MVPTLIQMGVATDLDTTMLQGLSEWWADYRATFADEPGYASLQRRAMAWKNFCTVASRFGLDPSSRTQLRVAPEHDSDPLVRMMHGG